MNTLQYAALMMMVFVSLRTAMGLAIHRRDASAPSSCVNKTMCSWSWNHYQENVGDSETVTSMSLNVEHYDGVSYCKEGDSFGFTESTIWVDQGCRAQFTLCTTLDPVEECYHKDRPQDYKGNKSTSSTGKQCLAWNTIGGPPAEFFGDGKLPTNNFCRDIFYTKQGDDGPTPKNGEPWCYTGTTAADEEVCGVPVCQAKKKGNCCANGEICSFTTSSDKFKCTCEPGWQGHFCQTEKKGNCRYVTCENGGICSVTTSINGFKCTCEPGWQGTFCRIDSSSPYL